MSRKWSIFKIYLYLFSNKIFWKLWLVFIIVWYVIPLHCSLEFYLISLGKQYYCLHVVIEWWCLCFITLMLINCIVRTCLFSPMIKHWLLDHLITWSLIVQNWVENEVQNTIMGKIGNYSSPPTIWQMNVSLRKKHVITCNWKSIYM